MIDIFLTNSLTGKKEKFEPINPPQVGMYTCGMTVYDFAHIGHGRKYVGDDVLRRILAFNGYKVKHVQNVTDVGHLTSDADEGEDKLEKGAKKVGKTVWEVAEFYTKHFYDSMDRLNILRPDIIAKATDHIKEQIELVNQLVEKGIAYETPEAVYFDISKFAGYGEMFGQKLEEKKVAVREGIKAGEHKKNPQDFSLWFKRVGRFSNHSMHWDSPWGDGFPGWHIECSAMAMRYLGEQFDIHTGGEDHLSIHHPNEIAQSEAATGKKPFVRYWVHYAHLLVSSKKMSKSLENYYTLEDIEKKGFDPLALRYLYLTAHYRKQLNFSWKALEAAQKALLRLREQVASFKSEEGRTILSEEKNKAIEAYRDTFLRAINDDMNTPQALAILWDALKSNIPNTDKYDLALSFDEVLGLRLSQLVEVKMPVSEEVSKLVAKREIARKENDFNKADEIREQIEKLGFRVSDTAEGQKLKPLD